MKLFIYYDSSGKIIGWAKSPDPLDISSSKEKYRKLEIKLDKLKRMGISWDDVKAQPSNFQVKDGKFVPSDAQTRR